MPRLLARLACLAGAACSSATTPSPGEADSARVQRIELHTYGLHGLSGLATDARGHLWTVPEHGGALAHIDSRGRARPVPLRGAPAGIDIEAIAWLGGDRFALGTESKVPGRLMDRIALVAIRGGVARVYATLELPYALWRMRGDVNAGIEGLCRAGPLLFAAAETVGHEGGRRYAPLGRYDLATGHWLAYRLRLTTRTGKISALTCRMRGKVVELLAVERHFEVTRVLRASFPRELAPGTEIAAEGALDVTATAAGRNLEGIAWLPDGGIALVVDNDFRDALGPNVLIVVPRELLP